MEDEQQNDKKEAVDNMEGKEGAAGAKLLLEGEQSNKTDDVEVKGIEQKEKVEDNNVGEGEEISKSENIENIEIKEVEQKDETTNAEKIIVKEEEDSKTENLENIEVKEDHKDQTENIEVGKREENDKTENVESIEIKEEEQKNEVDNKENIEVSEDDQKNRTDIVENNDAREDQKDKIEIKENTEVKEEVQKDKTEITENIKSTEEGEQGDKTNIEITEGERGDKTNIEITEGEQGDKTNIEITEGEQGDKTNIEITEGEQGDKTNIEITEGEQGDKTNIEITEGEQGDKTNIEVTEGELTDKLGRKLYTKQWKGSSPVLGCVFLCHGYAERCTPYYDGVAEECVKRGLLAFSHDHVGHGKSEGSKVQVDSMDWYVQPLIDNIKKVKEQYPELPFFIVGHSMGGLITMLTAIEQEDLVRGLVLMGPLVEPDPKMATPTKVWLAKTCSKIVPNFSMSGINSKDVTSDEEWVKKKKEDPDHYHGGFKARHSYVLLKALAKLDFAKLKTPFLILHGAEDKICAPAGSKKLYENAAAEDKSMEMVENGLHNLFIEKEPIKSNSLKLCFDWIEARLGKKDGELNNKTDNVEVKEMKEKETIEITENNLVGEVEENNKTENLENNDVKEEDRKD